MRCGNLFDITGRGHLLVPLRKANLPLSIEALSFHQRESARIPFTRSDCVPEVSQMRRGAATPAPAQVPVAFASESRGRLNLVLPRDNGCRGCNASG